MSAIKARVSRGQKPVIVSRPADDLLIAEFIRDGRVTSYSKMVAKGAEKPADYISEDLLAKSAVTCNDDIGVDGWPVVKAKYKGLASAAVATVTKRTKRLPAARTNAEVKAEALEMLTDPRFSNKDLLSFLHPRDVDAFRLWRARGHIFQAHNGSGQGPFCLYDAIQVRVLSELSSFGLTGQINILREIIHDLALQRMMERIDPRRRVERETGIAEGDGDTGAVMLRWHTDEAGGRLKVEEWFSGGHTGAQLVIPLGAIVDGVISETWKE